MRSFGFKIVERDRDEIAPVVGRAQELGCPLEVGLYYGDGRAWQHLMEHLPRGGLPVVVHLDHRRLSLFRQESREAPLREQLDLAARLGAGYVITHVSPYPMTPRPERRTEVLERLLTGLGFTLGLCADYGLGLHIENTYHNLAFYRGLFQAAADAGLEGAHFCFDLGHGKVWSTQRLGDWLGFLGDLDQAGARIHFHLHANGGLNDDHLSFPAADRLCITGPDGYTGPWDSYEAMAEIAARFPASIKVFEVPAGEAIANRDHVLGRIAALARPTSGSLSDHHLCP
jgi:sugar phosphate isomerase/epimerase